MKTPEVRIREGRVEVDEGDGWRDANALECAALAGPAETERLQADPPPFATGSRVQFRPGVVIDMTEFDQAERLPIGAGEVRQVFRREVGGPWLAEVQWDSGASSRGMDCGLLELIEHELEQPGVLAGEAIMQLRRNDVLRRLRGAGFGPAAIRLTDSGGDFVVSLDVLEQLERFSWGLGELWMCLQATGAEVRSDRRLSPGEALTAVRELREERDAAKDGS